MASGNPKVRSRLFPHSTLPRRGGDFKIDPFSGRFGQISRKMTGFRVLGLRKSHFQVWRVESDRFRRKRVRFRRNGSISGSEGRNEGHFGVSNHRYFDLQGVKSRPFGGSFSLACSVPQRFRPLRTLIDVGRQTPRSTLRTSKTTRFRPRLTTFYPLDDTRAQTGVF